MESISIFASSPSYHILVHGHPNIHSPAIFLIPALPIQPSTLSQHPASSLTYPYPIPFLQFCPKITIPPDRAELSCPRTGIIPTRFPFPGSADRGQSQEVTLMSQELDCEQDGGSSGLWPQRQERCQQPARVSPLNQMAPAGADWVLGYATQASLAGADDVDGSLGLWEVQTRAESPRCREEGGLDFSGSRGTAQVKG